MKTLVVLLAALGLASYAALAPTPAIESELVFPLEHGRNHASMVVEAPNGDPQGDQTRALRRSAWIRARPQ